jgi:DtxR family Mn-dependent transcriptional regulator
LIAFAVFAALTCALAWPRTGLAARLLRLSSLDERVRLEDALKHVHTCELLGQACTLESLAGRLEISTGRAATLLSRLAAMGLVRIDGVSPELTEDGRRSAVRVIRTHRLWERYLADRTGVPPGEWHEDAERMEHALSAEEADALEARLGHPRWDPHGDPIPTSEGEMPPLRGISLSSASPGRTVEIVHLEDEPREIYDALLRDGMAPGGRLEVLARSERGVRLKAGGREWEVDPIVARNVTVRPLPAGVPADAARVTLRDAAPGEAVRVVGISSTCQGTQRRRLLDLGVVRGTVITPELVSSSGDPVAYRIRGALIALRREQASWITIERIPAEEVA